MLVSGKICSVDSVVGVAGDEVNSDDDDPSHSDRLAGVDALPRKKRSDASAIC